MIPPLGLQIYVQLCVTSDLLTPKFITSCPCLPWTTCANWHQNLFVIMFSNTRMNKRMDERMDRWRAQRLCLPDWPDRGTKNINYRHISNLKIHMLKNVPIVHNYTDAKTHTEKLWWAMYCGITTVSSLQSKTQNLHQRQNGKIISTTSHKHCILVILVPSRHRREQVCRSHRTHSPHT